MQFCSVETGYGNSACGFSPSSSKILIKGGTVVNAHHQEVADVYVEDGIIVAVKPNIKVPSEKNSTMMKANALSATYYSTL